MIEYRGQYTTAKVMIDSLDTATVQQIYSFISHKAFTNQVIIMPDTHAGAGAVIGFTMEIPEVIIPNIVGVDLNCGMLSENVGKNLFAQISREDLDKNIRQLIPFGTSVHKSCKFNAEGHSYFWELANYKLRSFTDKFNDKYGTSYNHPVFTPDWLYKKCEDIGVDYIRVLNSVGTLGGGNHFIEVGKSENTGDYWITIHSGSRQLGLKIANYWQRQAGKGQLAYLEGEDMYNYLSDVVFTQVYANESRNIMQDLIHNIIELDVKESISCIHNFIDFDDFIIRKGAIRSYKGEKMIIPFNMEDGILICEGKSNPDWNFSAPHGAGRVGSRSWAKENLSVDDAKERMIKKGIYCSKLPADELKGAYKDPKIIEDAIEPTATIIDRLIPVLAMKD
jgi:RNA-splicing ligase RtcB